MMSSRAQQILQAGSHVRVELSPTEWQHRERALQARLARRAQRRRLVMLATLIVLPLVAVSSAWLLRGLRSESLAGAGGQEETRGGALRAAVVLSDGSELQASMDADWHERVSGDGATRQVEVQVRHGRVRLNVVRHRPLEFRVLTGDLRVDVIGTAFSVERRGEKVSVAVEHGRVQVTQPGEPPTSLGAGEARTFSLADQVEAAPSAEAALVPQAPDVKASPAPKPSTAPAPGWRALAREGEYAAAYEQMLEAQVADVPGDLLLSADVARLSGHPARAIAPLRRVAERHAGDPRAALAAFTLGRVYLEDLGNPRDAAAAFRLTRRLQPGGPMAESALAREVEAWARAGETDKAKALGREYLARYPSGSKRKLVLQHAGEP